METIEVQNLSIWELSGLKVMADLHVGTMQVCLSVSVHALASNSRVRMCESTIVLITTSCIEGTHGRCLDL